MEGLATGSRRNKKIMITENRIQNLKVKFNQFPNWEDRYKKIIEMGKALPALDKNLMTEKYLVKGCQSQVWLVAGLGPDGMLLLKGDSDALIVKGLVAVVLDVYNGAPLEEVIRTGPEFIKDLGFEANLSPSRANGLMSMIKQIRLYAQAYLMMQNKSI
jgi:cysteine desulfuration protein SufE